VVVPSSYGRYTIKYNRSGLNHLFIVALTTLEKVFFLSLFLYVKKLSRDTTESNIFNSVLLFSLFLYVKKLSRDTTESNIFNSVLLFSSLPIRKKEKQGYNRIKYI